MKPILLLHGALDGPDAWRNVERHLRDAGHRVLVHDARALEPSPQATAHDALPLLPAHVVGHSRGATAAGWLAVEHPALVESLTVVASPPQASEAFRAYFRQRIPHARADALPTLEYLAHIPDDDFPAEALRRYRGRALVVEYEDDPLYSPLHTLFWRMFLPYADFERVPGGHRAFAENEDSAAWLAARVHKHVEAAEARGRAPACDRTLP